MKIEPLPVREILNGPYRKWFMNDLKPPASDIPYSTDSDVDLAELIVKPVCSLVILSINFRIER